MPVIVIDTNAIFGDYGLTKTIQAVALHAPKNGFHVVMPQVVIDEHCAHFRRDLSAAHTKAVAALDTLQELDESRPAVAVGDFDAETAAKAYREKLDRRIVELNIQRAPYPTVSHAQLVAKDLLHQKPFNASGKGYRDALLWATILEFAASADRIIFVTKNHNDFGQTLHSDLRAELGARKLPSELVVIEPDLRATLEKHVQPIVKRNTDNEPRLMAAIVTWLNANLPNIIGNYSFDPSMLGFSAEHEDARLLEVERIDAPVILTIRDLDDGASAVTIEFDIRAIFEAIFISPEERTNFGLDEYRASERPTDATATDDVFPESLWSETRLRVWLLIQNEVVITDATLDAYRASAVNEFSDEAVELVHPDRWVLIPKWRNQRR